MAKSIRRVKGSNRTVAAIAPGHRDESGAILILALVFVLVVTLSIFGIITFGGIGIKNTVNLKGQRSLEFAADSAVTAAIQGVRYSPLNFTLYPPEDCLPNGATLSQPDSVTMTVNQIPMVVDCTSTTLPSSATPRPQDRIIAFYACTTNQLSGTPGYCYAGNAVVVATVDFEDVSAGGVYECSSTNSATCGSGESIVSWVVQSADS